MSKGKNRDGKKAAATGAEKEKMLADRKKRAKEKRDVKSRKPYPLRAADERTLAGTPASYDWDAHPAIARKFFEVDWQHLLHRADEMDHKAAKMRARAEQLKSLGSAKSRAQARRLTAARDKMAELTEQLKRDGIDVDAILAAD